MEEVRAERVLAQRAVHRVRRALQRAPVVHEELDALTDECQVLRVQGEQRARIASQTADEEGQQESVLVRCQRRLHGENAGHDEAARNGRRDPRLVVQKGHVKGGFWVYGSRGKEGVTSGLENGLYLLENGLVCGEQNGDGEEDERGNASHLPLHLHLLHLVGAFRTNGVQWNCNLDGTGKNRENT